MYLHFAYTFCTFGANLYAQLAHIDNISASEVSWKFIKGPLLVGKAILFSEEACSRQYLGIVVEYVVENYYLHPTEQM